MKKKMILFLSVLSVIITLVACGKSDDQDTSEIATEIEETLPEDSSESESSEEVPEETAIPESSEEDEPESEPIEEEIPEVEHRTGDEIIGISDKDISDLHVLYYDSVINDVTGNWRLAVIAEDVDIQDYIFSYYQEYIKSDEEIHGIVNLSRNVTASINKIGNWLMVTEYDYVDGEEHDAKLLYSGTPLQSYIVYSDNGDIETVEE